MLPVESKTVTDYLQGRPGGSGIPIYPKRNIQYTQKYIKIHVKHQNLEK